MPTTIPRSPLTPLPSAPVPLPVIEGDGVRLRPVEERDIAALLRVLAEPAVQIWWGRYDDVRARREFLDPAYALSWVIDVDGLPAGAIQASEDHDPDYRHAELDVFLSGACQGRALGVAALRALMRWLASERGHHRFQIAPSTHNARAIRAYEKAGFQRVGVLRQAERDADGAWHDLLLMNALAVELDMGRQAAHDS